MAGAERVARRTRARLLRGPESNEGDCEHRRVQGYQSSGHAAAVCTTAPDPESVPNSPPEHSGKPALLPKFQLTVNSLPRQARCSSSQCRLAPGVRVGTRTQDPLRDPACSLLRAVLVE